jgi:hypothetical protein
MWDLPMFDLKDAAGVLFEVNACRSAYPNAYIRLNAYDASLGRQTTAFSVIVQRPAEEPGFRLNQPRRRQRLAYQLYHFRLCHPGTTRAPLRFTMTNPSIQASREPVKGCASGCMSRGCASCSSERIGI